MTRRTPLFCRLRGVARRLVREVRAVVMIEMAFAIPLLVLIGFAGLEIANLTLMNTRVSQMGLAAADNASRIAAGSSLALPQVRETDINEVLAGVDKQAGNMDFKAHGRIILSSLERNTDGGQWIHWQRCYGDLKESSAYGVEGTGSTGRDFLGMGKPGQEVKAAAGSAVMFVEIVYEYQPMLYGKWLGKRTIRSTAAFNVRETRDMTQVYAPGTKASCL